MSTTSMPISTSFYSLRTAFNFNTPSPSPSPVTEPNANIIETRGDSRYAFTTMPRRTDPANGLQKTKAGYTFSIAIRWPPSTKKQFFTAHTNYKRSQPRLLLLYSQNSFVSLSSLERSLGDQTYQLMVIPKLCTHTRTYATHAAHSGKERAIEKSSKLFRALASQIEIPLLTKDPSVAYRVKFN